MISSSSSDSEEETLLLAYSVNSLTAEKIRRRSRQRNAETKGTSPKRTRKRFWVNADIAKTTLEHGRPYSLVKQLVTDEERILSNLNLTAADFHEILGHIEFEIKKRNTNFRESLSPDLRLGITLRFLTTGDSFKSISENFCIGLSTVTTIVQDVCKALEKKLQPIVMPQRSTEALYELAGKFEEMWQFPNCVGVIDGRHLLVNSTGLSSTSFPDTCNYKGKCSIVLFGLSDGRNCFIAVDVVPGDQYEVEDFQLSLVDNMLPEDNIPAPKLFSETRTFLPYVVLGDDTFPFTKHLMIPYSKDTLERCPEKRVYNDKHYEALKVVEKTFGLMVQRYKILQKPLLMSYGNAVNIIKACCCLHNFIRQKEIATVSDQSVTTENLTSGLMPLAPDFGGVSIIGQEVRENFLTYFLSNSARSSGSNPC